MKRDEDSAAGAGTPVRVVGTGPIRAIISHGWIADHTLFEPFIDRIERRRFSCAFPDCPGYGARRNEPGPYSIAAVARDLLDTADRLGWSRFHVIGHSMGGMVAQRLTIDAPGRLASVILIAPVPASGAGLGDARRALLRRAIVEPDARRTLIDTNSGGIRPAAWVDHVLRLSLRTTRAAPLAGYLDAWSDTNFSREILPVAVPVHVIVGALDPGAPPTRFQKTVLRWYPHATLQVQPGVGHYPMQEQPAELYDAITRQLLAADRI